MKTENKYSQVVLAEKPSVAREIASILGATEKKEGYLSGNGVAVTWSFGHLIALAFPQEYGITGFRRENLPILPDPFKLVVRQVKLGKEYKADPSALKQLKVIKELFQQCDRIVVGTDSAREGELIFRYIYNYLGSNKPFDRLWINSLTERAIREGFQHLQPGTNYDNLYASARARSEADWRIGCNASQALTVAAGSDVFSLGRVQTPTLKMICDRYEENRLFVSKNYWKIRIHLEKDGVLFTAMVDHRFETTNAAHCALQPIEDGGQAQVITVEAKEVRQEPPLLFDLTALQKEANTKLGFSADKTLSLAQKLYESRALSYPRTGSRYISQDVFDEIPERLALLESYPGLENHAQTLRDQPLNLRSVNDEKITDHHALIITESLPGKFSDDEQLIYEMVATRMIESFSCVCVKEVTTVTLFAGNSELTAKGTVLKSAGWRAIRNEPEENENGERLPILHPDEVLPLSKVELLEKQTKPLPLHTESSLLGAMESAGNKMENEEERAAMKEAGIGTPATRAAIIETLFSRQYIVREKKSLVPTEKGMAVYGIVKDKKIADIQMTGMWENALAKIERGELDAATFGKGIEVYATQITNELLQTELSIASGLSACPCPKCKNGRILFFPKVAKCSNVDCNLTVFRNRSDKQLTDKQITTLVTQGKTEVIKGFKSKTGKPFDAALGFDEQYQVMFIFPDKRK